MDFGLLPPDVNSSLMYTGPGSGPMLAAAASWDEVAAGLEAAASAYASEIAELTVQWIGPSSMLMAAAAARHLAWLQLVAAQAVQTAAQAYTAAAAYEAAYAMTVPPPLIAANRMQLMVLIATNFFGQNTAAIAATEAEYMEMWIQDATAMYGYAAVAETASALEPFDEPQQTTNPAGQEDQTNAVARSTADTARARTQSGIQQLSSTATTTENLTPGETVNVAPGGATVDNWVEITVTNGYPVSFSRFQGFVVGPNGPLVGLFNNGVSFSLPANSSGDIAFDGVFLSGTFTPVPSFGTEPVAAPVTIASGGGVVAGGAQGAIVTLDASGSATAVTWGTITTGPVAVTPVVPVAPSASGAVAAAPAAAASPGLAGTAGIQPQVNVAGLMEWAQGLSGAEVAELAEAAG